VTACTWPRSGATSFGEDTKIVTLRTAVSGMTELHKRERDQLGYYTALSIQDERIADEFRAIEQADGGSGDADTSNSGPTWSASEANLREHAVRLRKRRGRYCLRRSCEGYDKASSSNQPDHSYPPLKDRSLYLQDNSATTVVNTS
jgi:hypothetical protein